MVAFPNSYKNLILDILTGRTVGALAQNNRLAGNAATFRPYVAPLSNTASPLAALITDLSTYWGSPIAGTQALALPLTPNASGTVGWGRIALAAGNIDGLITASGNGGMLITPSVAWISGTPTTLAATLRCPFNNGSTLRVNQALANAICNAMVNGPVIPMLPNTAVVPILNIYNGAQPATADTAITTQTLLYTYSVNNAMYQAAAGGAAAMNGNVVSSGNALANGTATWFRITNGGYTIDGSVGTAGMDMTVASTTYSTGVAAPLISGCTLTFP